jgi:hypothetical protein
MDRPVIAERNVVRSNIMVAPLDSIHDTIQTYHLGYLHNCACVVYTKLVRLFYVNLKVVQDDDRGVVLQSNVDGHTITVDPQIISQFIGVPVLQIYGNSYNEVVIPPSLDDLREFFHAVLQGEEHTTTIKIGALSAPHCVLAKIVQHNLWPVVRRNDLILKRAQFSMPSVFACLSVCASIFWALFWRLVMRAIPVSRLDGCSNRLFYRHASILLASQRQRSRTLSASRL